MKASDRLPPCPVCERRLVARDGRYRWACTFCGSAGKMDGDGLGTVTSRAREPENAQYGLRERAARSGIVIP